MADLSALTGGYNWGGLLNASMDVFLWTLVGLLFIGLIVFIWWIFSFKHTLVIKEKYGKPLEVDLGDYYENTDEEKTENDKALPKLDPPRYIIPYRATMYKCKVVTKKGIKYIKTFKTKVKFKIPDQAFQNITKKGKKYFELTKISERLYAPTFLNEYDPGKHTYMLDDSWFDWVINDIERDHQKYFYQSFWDKYGGFIMQAAMLVIVLVIIVATLRYSNDIVETAKPLAQSLSEAADKFAQAMKTQNI